MNFAKHAGKTWNEGNLRTRTVCKQLIEIIVYCADATAHTVASLFFCLGMHH